MDAIERRRAARDRQRRVQLLVLAGVAGAAACGLVAAAGLLAVVRPATLFGPRVTSGKPAAEWDETDLMEYLGPRLGPAGLRYFRDKRGTVCIAAVGERAVLIAGRTDALASVDEREFGSDFTVSGTRIVVWDFPEERHAIVAAQERSAARSRRWHRFVLVGPDGPGTPALLGRVVGVLPR